MTQIDLWPWEHEAAAQREVDKFIAERDHDAISERDIRHGFWFGWRRCLRHLRAIEDARAVEERQQSPVGWVQCDPSEPEYGPPVDPDAFRDTDEYGHQKSPS